MISTSDKPAAKAFWRSGVSRLALAASLAMAAPQALANPAGGSVVAGNAAIARAGNTLTITQTTDRAIVNWDSFSIGAGETTRFVQPGTQSVTANRVTGVDPTRILGNLEATGQIVLVNPNGVVFGQGARVDAAGLVATVHDFADSAFMAGGALRFEDGGSTAPVVNEGLITIKDAGLAALVAPHVRNSGVIRAELGRVAIASAKGFSVDLHGDGLVSFAPGDALDATIGDGSAALVEAAGEIHAGEILLTARAAEAVVNASVNVSGVVQATTVSQSGGVIRLSGPGRVTVANTADLSASGRNGGGAVTVQAGQFSTDGAIRADGAGARGQPTAAGGVVDIAAGGVALGGHISASGASGGSIEVSASGLLSLAENVAAMGAMGAGGAVSYKAGRIIETSTAATDASGLTHGGVITVAADSQIASSGVYSTAGVFGRGGRIDITAPDLRLLSASLSAAGRQQGGLVRIGGLFQGGKEPDPAQPYHASFLGRWRGLPDLAAADETFVNDATIIDVSAWQGAGGTAVIWSDERTTFLGGIDARGSKGGGSVEISSAGDLRRAELTDVRLGDGHLLLDPKNIIIGQQATVQSWAYQGVIGVGHAATQNNVDETSLDESDAFALGVSLNAAGDRLAIGAQGDDGATNAVSNAGAVYLYSFTDTRFSGGTLQAVIGSGYTGGKNVNVAQLEADDLFGRSVSLNAVGDRLAVGAYGDDGSGVPSTTVNNYGAAYLFSFTDEDFSGGTLESIIGSGYTGGKNVSMAGFSVSEHFGLSVDLNAAGNRLAVGANGDDGASNSVSAAGSAHLFTFTDTNFSGAQRAAIIGNGYTGPNDINVPLEASDSFGLALSLNAAGDRLAVGAHSDDGLNVASNANNFGAVYLFTFGSDAFTGGVHAGTIGENYAGGKNVNMAATLDVADTMGYGVALNAAGDRLAVGVLSDDGAGVGSASDNYGAVHLFTFSDSSFTGGVLAGTIGRGYAGGRNIDLPGLSVSDHFGGRVALNGAGDRLAAGAYIDDGFDDSVLNAGAVHLFTFTDTDFNGGVPAGTIGAGYGPGKNINLRLDSGDRMGIGVSLNAAGDRLALGAYGDDGPNNATVDSGAVYLFSFADTRFSGGVLEAIIGKGYTGGKNIDVSLLEAGDLFGRGLSLNAAGDRLAASAIGDDGFGVASNPNNHGAVHLFSFADANFSGGVYEATIGDGYTGGKNVNLPSLDANDHFGTALSLNAAGDRLAVSAQYDDGLGNGVADSGAAYLYSFSDTNFSGGALQATIGQGYTGGKNVSLALATSDRFGQGISLNAAGDRMAVGVIWDDGAANNVADSGAVYLFSFADTNFTTGTLQGRIGSGYTGGKNVNMPLVTTDGFGLSVSLNAIGDRLAVGTWADDGAADTVNESGAVHLFTFSDANFSAGALAASLGAGYVGGKNIAVPLEVNDHFGFGVSLNGSGDRLAVAAYGDDGVANAITEAGAAYLFSFSDTSFSRGVIEGVIGSGYASGNDMYGPSLDAVDHFGTDVSLNAAGDRLAVGSYLDDGFGAGSNGDNYGAVQLFSFTDGNFSGGMLEGIVGRGYVGGKNINVALDIGDRFGRSVALNGAGNRMAVGAQGDDGLGIGSTADDYGAVHLFTFSDTNFSGGARVGMVGRNYVGASDTSVALDISDLFGVAVSLNAAGNLLAVGAPYDDGFGVGSTTDNRGALHLFSFTDSNFGGGAHVGTIGSGYTGGSNVNLTLAAGDQFGISASLNAAGDRLASGAYVASNAAGTVAGAGLAHLFTFADTSFGGGARAATIGSGYTGGKNINIALDASDGFGVNLGLNAVGDRLAVGVWLDDGFGVASNANNYGAVHTFSFTDNSFSGGVRTAILGQGYTGAGDANMSMLQTGDTFGISVALNGVGDRLAVGAHNDDGESPASASTNYGAVYLLSAATLTGPRTPPLNYLDFSGQTVTVNASDVAAMLAQGSAVTLQASNDITVANAIAVPTGQPVVGGLTLQAGRSILIDNNIATSGGNLTLIGNDLLANGVIDAQRDAGAAVITMASGVSIDAGAGAVNILLRDGAGKTNFETGEITLRSITAGFITAVNSGSTAGSGVTLPLGATLNASATGDALVLAGQDFTNNAGASALSATNGRWLVWSTDPAADVRGGLAYDFKQYNATYGVTPPAQAAGNGFLYSLAPVITGELTGSVSRVYDGTTGAALAAGNYTATDAIDGDTVLLNNPGAGVFDTKNVGAGKTVSVSGVSIAEATNGAATVYGYQLASTDISGAIGQITPATLTAGLTGSVSKVYDTNTGTSLGAPNYILSGVLGSDAVTLNNPASGTFDTKNVGAGKTVSVTGLALIGGDADGDGFDDAGNYVLASTAANAAIGEITPATLTPTLTGWTSREYDGTLTAQMIPQFYGLTGVLGADDVELTGPAFGTYDTKNVGEFKMVTATGLSLAGGDADGDGFNDAGNYQLSSTSVSGDIGEVRRTILTASLTNPVLKIYDGDTAASLTASNYQLTGVVSGESVALNNPVSGTYDTKNVGTGKTVTVGGLALVGGDADGDGFNDADNYELASTTINGAVGQITPKTLTASLTGSISKIYDRTVAAALAAGNYALSGVLAPDDVVLNNPASGTYDTWNVGAGKTVTVGGLALVGGDADTDGFNDAGNYQLASTSLSAAIGEITPATLTASLTGSVTKVYDRTTAATLGAGNYALSGVLSPDNVTLNNPTSGNYDTWNVGSGKTVTVTGLALAGGDANGDGFNDADNYVLASAAASGAIGEITPATLTAGLIGSVTKVYDANTGASLDAANYSLSGVLALDDVALNNPASGTYDTKNVGTGKTVTVGGLALVGGDADTDGFNDADNYELASTTINGAVGQITPKTLTASLTGSISKIYDRTVAAALAAGNYALSGVLAPDDVVLNNPASGTYDTWNVGTGKTVTVGGLALVGGDADTDGFNDAGNYQLASTSLSAAIGEITPKLLTASVIGDVAKVYDGGLAATLAAGNYSLAGVLSPDDVALNNPGSGSYDTRHVGTGKTVTVNGVALIGGDANGDGFNDAGNYQLASTTATGAVGRITPASLTASLTGSVSKVYDGTLGTILAPGNYALSGAVGADDVILNNPASGTYDTKNVGSGKTITVTGLLLGGADASNYTLSSGTVSGAIGQITPAAVSVSLTGTVSRVYDATTAATLAASNYQLSGAIGGDDLGLANFSSGTYDAKNVGNRTVTVTGLALTGADAANYILSSTSVSGAVGQITPATLTASLSGAVSKVYDTTTVATLDSGNYMLSGVLGSDVVSLNNPASGAYDNRNVGSGKAVTVSGLSLSGADAANYQLASSTLSAGIGQITPATVSASLTGTVSKVYDASTAVTLAADDYSLSGVLGADSVSLNHATLGSYDDKNVGSGKMIAVHGLTLSGADAGNYVLASSSFSGAVGEITPATLTAALTGQVLKVYDGTTAAALASGNYMLSGVLGADSVSLNTPGGGAYDSRNVGAGKLVNVSGLGLSGADAGNYQLASTNISGAVGQISPALVTASLTGTAFKIYDGSTAAPLSAGNYTLSGVLGADDVTLNAPISGAYDTRNAGAGKVVTVDGLTLGGSDADGDGFIDSGNYRLASTSVSAAIGEIAQATLSASLSGIVSKTYDGGTAAALTSGAYSLSGLLSGDSVTLIGTGVFDSRHVGAGKTVSFTSLALGGADAGNYRLAATDMSAAAGMITPATLTVSLTGVVSKVYDAATTATPNAHNISISGLLGDDSVIVNTGSAAYSDKNVGPGKMVTLAGLTLAGRDAGNYVLADIQTNAGIGVITPATLEASLIGPVRKIYDGRTTVLLNAGNYGLSGVIGDDQVALNNPDAGAFETAEVGTGKIVTVSGLALLGADGRNYTLASSVLSAPVGEIAPATTPVITPSDPAVRETTQTVAASVNVASDLAGCEALMQSAPQLNLRQQLDAGSCHGLDLATQGFPAEVTAAIQGEMVFLED